METSQLLVFAQIAEITYCNPKDSKNKFKAKLVQSQTQQASTHALRIISSV
jgi:hypothetical protein